MKIIGKRYKVRCIMEDGSTETVLQSTIQAAIEAAEEATGCHVIDYYVDQEADVVLINEGDDIRREVRWH